MNRTARFWDRIAKRYAGRPVADEASYEEKLRITREYLSPDMNVLEIGCGTGSTALALAPGVGHILATDISANMIEIARGKLQAEGIDNVAFEQSTVEALTVAPGSMDAVLAHNILHLLDDWQSAIPAMRDVLKPGGVFVSSTACLGDSMNYLRPVAALGRLLNLLPLVRFFSKSELVDCMTAHGFTIEHQWQPKRQAAVFIVARKA
jgi:ubiquinone/menaquinone biosynthesis C-methylase UbiE